MEEAMSIWISRSVDKIKERCPNLLECCNCKISISEAEEGFWIVTGLGTHITKGQCPKCAEKFLEIDDGLQQ